MNPPSLTPSAPTSVATSTLTLNGSITATGGADATQSGFAYGTVSDLSTVIATSTLGAQTGTASFSQNLSSLTPNTLYYFRAYAVNSAGTSTGSILSTTTLAVSAPTVTTQVASSITATTATGNGNITVTGNINPTIRGVVYGLTAVYTATTTPETGDFSTGAFTASITSLTCNTLYHVASYATNSQGNGYGSDQTFTTTACVPTVTTQAASPLAQTSATLNGTITDTGGENATTRGFQYGADTSYGSTQSESSSYAAGSFSTTISSLTCNTSYHFRSYATNSVGTSYGSDQSLTTNGCPGNGAPGNIGGGGGAYIPPEPPRPAIYYPDGTVVYLPVPTATPATPGPPPATAVPPVPSAPASPKVAEPSEPSEPSVTEVVSEAVSSTLSLLKRFALSVFTSEDKQKLPPEVVFATPSGLDHFNVSNQARQTFEGQNSSGQADIRVLQGKSIDLAVKADKPVTNVTGYLTIKKIDRKTALNDLKNQKNKSNMATVVGATTVDKLVLETFKYTDPDQDGIYTATITAPKVHGEYDIMTILEYTDTKLGYRELHLTAVVDPEGYVYYRVGNDEARVGSAKVTLWRQNPKTASFELWPATDFKQVNPQITDKTGNYSFLVPEGTYRLTVSAPDYYDYTGQTFTVAQGVGVHENIKLTKRHWWNSVWRWVAGLF